MREEGGNLDPRMNDPLPCEARSNPLMSPFTSFRDHRRPFSTLRGNSSVGMFLSYPRTIFSILPLLVGSPPVFPTTHPSGPLSTVTLRFCAESFLLSRRSFYPTPSSPFLKHPPFSFYWRTLALCANLSRGRRSGNASNPSLLTRSTLLPRFFPPSSLDDGRRKPWGGEDDSESEISRPL